VVKMEKNNKSEKEMLERILTSHELSILTNAYKMLKSTDNEEFKKTLLRRIDDVISMIRYIELSYPMFHHADYDSLGARLTNLEIAMNSIKQPENNERSFNYLADGTNTPLILRSIEFLDTQRYYEAGDLLSRIASGKIDPITVGHEIKVARSTATNILYFDNDSQIIIYDLIGGIKPKMKREELKIIKEKCNQAIEEGLDPTIQKIYDEMVYQALNFNVPKQGNGYALTKKRDYER